MESNKGQSGVVISGVRNSAKERLMTKRLTTKGNDQVNR
jgi:hypothetical protein